MRSGRESRRARSADEGARANGFARAGRERVEMIVEAIDAGEMFDDDRPSGGYALFRHDHEPVARGEYGSAGRDPEVDAVMNTCLGSSRRVAIGAPVSVERGAPR